MSLTRPPQQATVDEDPTVQKFSASALDFLLIELVPLAQRITQQLHEREQALVEEYKRSRKFNQTASKTLPTNNNANPTTTTLNSTTTRPRDSVATTATINTKDQTSSVKDSATGAETLTSLGFPAMDSGTREGVFLRLDGLGYRVGQGLVERFSANKPRPQSPLDTIKFVCKDLWTIVFRKNIDNLKTNHRGIYVLTDNRFQPLSRMSVDRRAGPKAAEEALSRAQTYLYFPCGVIRGALAGLGIEATVEATSIEIPSATFQIRTKGAVS